MKREPLFSAATVTAFVAALLQCLVSFGLDITNDQQSKLLVVIGLAASFAVAFLARPKVTPIDDPRDGAGELLVPQSRAAAPSGDPEPFATFAADEDPRRPGGRVIPD